MCISRPHLPHVALTFYLRHIISKKLAYVYCGPMPFMLLRVAARVPYYIIYNTELVCTSRPHLSKVALLFRWRLIYYTKSPCANYNPMPFMQLDVPARTPCYVTLLVYLLSLHDCQMRIATPYCSFSLES